MEEHPHRDLICRFLFAFAAFEQALKAAGFHHGDGSARPNWMEFADENEVLEEFQDRNSSIGGDVQLLIDDPPRQQIVQNGNLEWDEAPPNQDTISKTALVYVRRVRNNLFHGGKMGGERFPRERDMELIDASLSIIHRCAKLHSEVRTLFYRMLRIG